MKKKVFLEGNEGIFDSIYRDLLEKGYGFLRNKEHRISMVELLYLLKKDKVRVFYQGKEMNFDNLINYAKNYDPRIYIRYRIYEDLRDKGYVLKAALKYGADFRVYDEFTLDKTKNIHAKWLLRCYYSTEDISLNDLASFARVAHSVNKTVLLAIMDEEGDITYYELKWKRM